MISDATACPARVPTRTMDIDESNAMLHKWIFGDHGKFVKFRMEKCIGCDLCRILCPTSCIELGPVPEIASGKLQGVPPILINHETCAYCGLCAAICPTSALEFRSDPKDFITMNDLPAFQFKTFVDLVQKKLMRSFDHPASADIHLPKTVQKPTEGKVLLRNDLLAKCDPMGCKGCLQICPTGCFWVPKKAEDIAARGKITMDDDLCIHCGACHNACPQRIIEVTRTKIAYKMPAKKPWHAAWESRINLLIGPSVPLKREPPLHVVEGLQEGPTPAIEPVAIKELPPEIKRQLQRDFDLVKDSLAQVNMRYWIEFKKLEPLRKAINKLLPAPK